MRKVERLVKDIRYSCVLFFARLKYIEVCVKARAWDRTPYITKPAKISLETFIHQENKLTLI